MIEKKFVIPTREAIFPPQHLQTFYFVSLFYARKNAFVVCLPFVFLFFFLFSFYLFVVVLTFHSA